MEKSEIFRNFEEIVTSLGYLLIDVVFRGDNRMRILEVYIDNEKGITPEDCKLVSQNLNELIERNAVVEGNYRLDVSSPGVDRPLKYLVQYGKHINRKFEINFSEGGELKKFTGALKMIVDDTLYFADNKTEIRVKFEDVKNAKVLISF